MSIPLRRHDSPDDDFLEPEDRPPFATSPSLGRLVSRILRKRSLIPLVLGLCFVAFLYIPYDEPKSRTFRGGSLREGDELVDWSQFAYVQYATEQDYLCNSLMLFETLHRLGSRAERVLLYPESMHRDLTNNAKSSELLVKAKGDYAVKIKPISLIHHNSTEETWADSFTKLLTFNQTEYKRVLMLDSDATLMQTMDELFLLPSTIVAAPRAYWGDENRKRLSSSILLVEPSYQEFRRVQEAIVQASDGEFDMEIINALYGQDCLILPNWPYDMMTGELRALDHSAFLEGTDMEWDADAIAQNVTYVHFSDWPLPKPFIAPEKGMMEERQPACDSTASTGNPCREREIWQFLYKDFKRRRQKVCGLSQRKYDT